MPVNNMNQKGFIVIPALIWWVLGAVVLTSVAVKEGAISIEYPPKTQEEVAINVSSPTPLPTYKPSPTPIPIQTPTPKPIQQVEPSIDPDPIISCNFPQSGTKKLRKSECSRSFDCQIGGQWYIYTDKNKCSEDQKNYWSKVYSPPATGNSNNIPSTPSEPTITCVLPYGTFQVPQVHCDNAKAILRDQESIKKNFNENMERIRQESDRKLEEITSRTFEPSYPTPTFPTPAPLRIEVETEPCVVVPPGFGGATSGRVNEAGFPCAN